MSNSVKGQHTILWFEKIENKSRKGVTRLEKESDYKWKKNLTTEKNCMSAF